MIYLSIPDSKVHRGQHGPPLGHVGPRWGPRCLHEPCYQGCLFNIYTDNIMQVRIKRKTKCLQNIQLKQSFDHYNVLLMKSLNLVAFWGFFRLGELVQRRGVQVVQRSGLQYTGQAMSPTLPSSKTTPSPVTIGVRRMPFVCPVAAVQEAVEARGPSLGQLFAHADVLAFPHARVKSPAQCALHYLWYGPQEI